MKFSAHMRGEDYTEFTYDVEASTHEEAEELIELVYPDADILSLHSATEIQEREADRYNRIAQEVDDGYYY